MKLTDRLCFAYVLFSLVASSTSLLAQSRVQPAAAVHSETISAGWSFRIFPGDPAVTAHPEAAGWEPATVPSSVQMDLLRNHRIVDPFTGDHEAELQWIGLADWEYRTTFQVSRATLAEQQVDLVFLGLDTFADVTVNGQQILAADNMFRSWRVPARSVLHVGANELRVVLHSPIRRLLPATVARSYQLPGEFASAFGDEPKGVQTANYVRKAAYQYGWDWGPRYVTEGIWHPVVLESWSGVKINDLHIAQVDIQGETAAVQAQLEVQAARSGDAVVTLSYEKPDGSTVTLPAVTVALHAGENRLSLPINIPHRKLWFPVGYGDPNLYTFHARLALGGHAAIATRTTGLRTVRLMRENDQWGKSFAFQVNGIPVFAKGADGIPFDSFPDRVTPERHRLFLQAARDANMNMIREWGGGYYESDDFYEQCDRLGLLVWQDFMFGGPIPPYNAAYRDNVRREAVEQVKRLRDHPSVVIWVGNNEVETGWETWGDRISFKASISPEEREKIAVGMALIFDGVLKDAVSLYSPDIPYWPSTPSSDNETAANNMHNGDVHSWEVWSNSAPIEDYLKDSPRFLSEFGLESMPDERTLRYFAAPGDLTTNSTVMNAHQKFSNGKGNERLLFYIRKYYGEPRDFASFAYLSQVMQAEGIELAVKHLRSARPQTMGTLYWQLNDCWPAASWASIDYFGRWKALQFHARRFYAQQLVAPVLKDGGVEVSVVSDLTQPVSGTLRMRLMGFDGKQLNETNTKVAVGPLASTSVLRTTAQDLLAGASAKSTYAVFDLEEQGKTVSRGLLFFAPAVELALPAAQVKTELVRVGDHFELTVSSDTIAREVWLSFGELDATLSDNAFDLLPGESRTIEVHSAAKLQELTEALRSRSLVDATQVSSDHHAFGPVSSAH